MMHRDGSDPQPTGLDALRAAAHAEADAQFDERALEAQRASILQRIDHVNQRARVIRFPGVPAVLRPSSVHSRRWVSAAAAAGLVIGLITGQLLHVMPGDNWAHREAMRTTLPAETPTPAPRMGAVPVRAIVSMDADDELLDAIDIAVSRQGASEFRALNDLTFAYEPR
jgi:hypothetical protein